MTKSIVVQPLAAPPNSTIRPPGSKSLTNRALVCSALADGTSTLLGALDSEDTRVMIEGLRALGIPVDVRLDEQRMIVQGCDGQIPRSRAELFVANSGTTVRFLTALAALAHGTYRLHGTRRMHERPIQDLLDTLAEIGVGAASEMGTGCPPVIVTSEGLKFRRASIRGDVSSQFLSALLMVMPCCDGDQDQLYVDVEIVGPLVSKPYVEMTVAVMEAFEAQVNADSDLRYLEVGRSGYRAREYEIEPDASAASYFWAAAAITGGQVRVEGLNRYSLQGDVAFCECLARMGCRVDYDLDGITVRGGPLRGVEVDMNAISDTVQTLAAVALFASGPTTIRNVAHIRHKETDRIGNLAVELRKLGARVDELTDGLRITPGTLHGATIDTYDDHRMAMSLAVVGLKIPGVAINDPDCTAKTYPRYFEDLQRIGR